MTRIGNLYGPDATFLGVAKAEVADPQSYRRRGRRDHRSPVRRRHLAPAGSQVRPAGDQVHRLPAARRLPPAPGARRRPADRPEDRRRRRRGDAVRPDRAVPAPARRRRARRRQGRPDPGDPRRRPHDHLPRRDRRGPARRLGPGLADPLRRARRHRQHPVRLALRARNPDAPPDRLRRGPRRPVPADRPARLLARAGDAGLDGQPADAQLRDDRDRRARPGRLPDRGVRDRNR